jgi:hypothetical protein
VSSQLSLFYISSHPRTSVLKAPLSQVRMSSQL